MNKLDLFSISISTGLYREFVDNIISTAKKKDSDYVCVANVHMLMEAQKDRTFGNIIRNANIITPDGKPLTWAMRVLLGVPQDRVAGMDLLPDLLRLAERESIRVFFYGSEQSVLDQTCAYLKRNYPKLEMGSYSPPFRKLNDLEEQEIVNMINGSGAQMVFVILGCPKQEKWMASMKGRIRAVMVGVGGALPVLIGIQKRAPKWMQHNGLEWSYRLMQEPSRLFKRYAITNSLFMYLFAKTYIARRFYKRPA